MHDNWQGWVLKKIFFFQPSFPQANSGLNIFRLFSVLLHKNEQIPGVVYLKLIFLSNSAHPNVQ
jgi:hypothetical protein